LITQIIKSKDVLLLSPHDAIDQRLEKELNISEKSLIENYELKRA